MERGDHVNVGFLTFLNMSLEKLHISSVIRIFYLFTATHVI